MEDLEIVAELSLARTDPLGYARFLEEFRSTLRPDGFAVLGAVLLQTREGAAAVDEAIAFLRGAAPLPPLAHVDALARAARDHVLDLGPRGMIGHGGADGSSFADRVARHARVVGLSGENIFYGLGDARFIVVQTLIDDGVPDRGHRRNVFEPAYRTAGAARGPHAAFGQVCVTEFAAGVQAFELG